MSLQLRSLKTSFGLLMGMDKTTQGEERVGLSFLPNKNSIKERKLIATAD